MKTIWLVLFVLIFKVYLVAEDVSLGKLGWEKTEAGDHKAAIELFKKCIAEGNLTKASLARTYRNIGIALKRDGRPKESLEYYGKAIELAPSDVHMDYVNRGNAYSEMKEYDKALLDYDKAQKIVPNYNEAYYNRGIVYEKKEKLKEAKEEFMLAYKNGLRSQLLQERLIAYGVIEAEPKTLDVKLPDPPKGYSWEAFPAIKAAFLKPDGWFVIKGVQEDTYGLLISKEKIEENKYFKTGMTVNVIKGIDKKTKMSPYQYALAAKEEAKKSLTFTKEWDKDIGPFKSVGFLYTKKDNDETNTVHNVMIANEKTGTLYLVIFESPSAEWEETWKIAEPMLLKIFIDDKI